MNNNTRAIIPILRDFYDYDGSKLVTFATNISVNLDPLLFPGLPFAPKDIKAMADDLSLKLAATITGGSVEFAAKNAAFGLLANALNADANVVEIGAGLNLEKLLATGFLPASNNRSQSPLDDTAIVGLWNNGTTKALLQLLRVLNAKAYQVQTSTDGGKTWVEACIPSTRPNPDRADEPGAGHDLCRAGAGHRRQHGRQRLVQLPDDHVHLSRGGGAGSRESAEWGEKLKWGAPHPPYPLSLLPSLGGSGEGEAEVSKKTHRRNGQPFRRLCFLFCKKCAGRPGEL
jgi:hypothetical protein